MLVHIIIVIISICISAVIGYLLSSKQSTTIKVRDALLGAVLGVILLTIVLLQYELIALRGLRDQIVKPNPLDQLKNLLEHSPSDAPMIESMMSQKDKIEKELSDIVRGRIELRDAEEVVQEWARLFSQSATIVNATNFVSPMFWLSGSEFSTKQFEIQNLARRRGVIIKRIFIYVGDTDEEREQIRRLAEQQRSIGIEVRFMSYSKVISSQSFIKYSPVLNGAIDFVVYDLNVVLLTFPNPDTREIEWGVLSKERPIVDGARDLFEKLWSIADETVW
jgi:hypothetical protein